MTYTPTLRVVIADDSAPVRERLQRLIGGQAGVEIVGMATDGEAALAQILELNPDVAILDLQMPKRSGLEVLAEVRRLAPHVQTLILTNFVSEPYRRRCLDAGARAFLDKSKDFTSIPSHLSEIDANRRP